MHRSLLFAGLLVSGSFGLFASTDTDLLAMVPSSTTMVSGIDLARARSSTFGQFMLTKMEAQDNHVQEFIRDTGFDPRYDVQSLVLASPGPSGDKQPGKFILLARGSFDQQKITSAAVKKGAVVRAFLGQNLILPNPKETKQVAVAFPQSGVILMGDLDSVHEILQNHSAPTVLDPDLQHSIDQVGSKNDAWFASIAGGNMLAHHLALETNGQTQQSNNQSSKVIESIVHSAGGIRFGDLVEDEFDATTRSAKDATSVSDVVRFFASMVQMQREKDPRAGILASSFDNMTLKTSGDTVNMSFTIAEKDMEKLAALGPGHGTLSHN